MKGGYVGKMLFIDLSTGLIQVEDLNDELARNFIGGFGIGASVLYNRMKPGVDPLGPENILGFVTGPCTATGASYSGRYMVVCKSPITGTWNDANSGGFFGPELKRAGYDAVFISGAAQKPVYIWINEGKVEICDAAHLWGMDVCVAEAALKNETGENKLRAALIGPPGENQDLIACIMNDGHRAAARGGPGAVMGSKNLKAVVVRGTGKVPIAEPETLMEINKKAIEATKTTRLGPVWKEAGTGSGSASSALIGDSPVKNWGGVGITEIGKDAAQSYSTYAMNRYKTKPYACSNCPIGCGAQYNVNEGPWQMEETDRPEYESIAAFGSLLLNTDMFSILKCNDICNRTGMDTISVGSTIAWAIECFENGILTLEEIDGIDLRWGNAAAIVEMTEAMGAHRGFGAILAQGSAKAVDILGKGSEYLQTVRGLELPMHDPRVAPGMARVYQYDPSPARHVKGGLGLGQITQGPEKYNAEGSGPKDVQGAIFSDLINCAGLCMYFTYTSDPSLVVPMIAAVTGISPQELMTAATRVFTLRHSFNLREGLIPADFVLPPRSIGQPPLTEGPSANVSVPSEQLADNFFATLGWNRNSGKPSREVLEKIGGLDEVIENLYG